MKKLLAIIIAAVMIAACSVTAFAETTDVSYDVQPTYTLSIPASVTLGDADVTADITASDVIMEDGKQIKVELTSASNTASGSTFNAKNGDSTVTYTITGDEAIAVGDTVATFTANGSKTLTFSAADKSAATVAGTHTETLTFTVKVEDAATVLAPALENDATVVIAYRWNGYNTTTFTFTNNGGTYSCNIGGDEPQDFSGSLTLNGTTLALSITNSVMSSRINLAISFDTTNDTYSFVTKGSWYNSHTVSVNGTNITDKLTEKN